MLGPGITGVCIVVGGVVFVWLAHGMARARLEVMPDAIWVVPMLKSPKEVPVDSIVRLAPILSNTYGGVVARSSTGRVFRADRTMLGYPQLIEYFQDRRPDLAIPNSAWPIGQDVNRIVDLR
jgi:hypothetical protein